MTNEQLAVLLLSYCSRLADILAVLKVGLENKNLNYHLNRGKWIGKGEEDLLVLKGIRDPDWEWGNGDPIILDDLKSLLAQLRQDVWVLRQER